MDGRFSNSFSTKSWCVPCRTPQIFPPALNADIGRDFIHFASFDKDSDEIYFKVIRVLPSVNLAYDMQHMSTALTNRFEAGFPTPGDESTLGCFEGSNARLSEASLTTS
jgi:hypothetical protein